MLTNLVARVRQLGRRFVSPTFRQHFGFAGTRHFVCQQTGQDFAIIPAGMGWLVSVDGNYIGKRDGYSDALELIELEARAAIRHQLAA